MIGQNGNSKPNDAEGLAFPLSGNEKLIDEAAEAMLDAARELLGVETIGERPREMTREYARRAFAVFEKALTPTEARRISPGFDTTREAYEWLTPTEDEREDMIAFLLRDHNFEESPWGRTYTDAEIANALRRSEARHD